MLLSTKTPINGPLISPVGSFRIKVLFVSVFPTKLKLMDLSFVLTDGLMMSFTDEYCMLYVVNPSPASFPKNGLVLKFSAKEDDTAIGASKIVITATMIILYTTGISLFD